MDELEDAISDAQLREWTEFFALEPWGSEVEFLRTGIVASTLVNVAPNRKQGAKPASPKDFMPQPARRGDGLDPKRIKAEFLGAFGGRIKRKDKADGR